MEVVEFTTRQGPTNPRAFVSRASGGRIETLSTSPASYVFARLSQLRDLREEWLNGDLNCKTARCRSRGSSCSTFGNFYLTGCYSNDRETRKRKREKEAAGGEVQYGIKYCNCLVRQRSPGLFSNQRRTRARNWLIVLSLSLFLSRETRYISRSARVAILRRRIRHR